jgi:hypothetical protein
MGLKSKPLDRVRPDVPVNDVTKEDVVRINLNVPDSLRQAWKMAAVKEKRPLTDLIIEAMSMYLNTHKGI